LSGSQPEPLLLVGPTFVDVSGDELHVFEVWDDAVCIKQLSVSSMEAPSMKVTSVILLLMVLTLLYTHCLIT
jgi:hypothetical protein